MLSGSKSTAGQVLGVKRIVANTSNKPKLIGQVSQGMKTVNNMQMDSSKQIVGNAQRPQNREGGHARAQSNDTIPEQASPHIK